MKDANIVEKELHPMNGIPALIINLIVLLLSVALIAFGPIGLSAGHGAALAALLLGCVLLIMSCIAFAGLKTVRPNEALVLTLFGKYYGTIKKSGFYFVNPFSAAFSPLYEESLAERKARASEAAANGRATGESGGRVRKTVSLKTQTLNNGAQKVNDVLGNPIIIGSVVIWRVEDPTSAVFNVENYSSFLSTQTDSTIRNIARLYPYDIFEEDETADGLCEQSLRGSALEIAENMRAELQKRVETAGIVVEEVRITHLAYAEEIAAAMLQRQQASAIIAARQKIVDGAVGMVKMAIDKLGEDEIVILDEERKAAMVSNLLVVLCGNKDAQPVVNSGSIY